MNAKVFVFLALIASIICAMGAKASDNSIPQWWIDSGIAVSAEEEFSRDSKAASLEPANVGQLMSLAELAAAHLNEKVEGGAGNEINELVRGFRTHTDVQREDYFSAVTVGQVINVAKPFYDRLHEVEGVTWPEGMSFIGGAGKYPWPDLPANATNADKYPYYSAANVGQIKYLFSWDISGNLGMDFGSDGLPNGWYNNWGNTFSDSFAEVSPLMLEAISPTMQEVKNGEKAEVKVRVRDLRGNNIQNVPVFFTLESSGDNPGNISLMSGRTEENGTVSVQYTGGESERSVVTASLIGAYNQKKAFVMIAPSSHFDFPDLSAKYSNRYLDPEKQYSSATDMVPPINDVVRPSLSGYVVVNYSGGGVAREIVYDANGEFDHYIYVPYTNDSHRSFKNFTNAQTMGNDCSVGSYRNPDTGESSYERLCGTINYQRSDNFQTYRYGNGQTYKFSSKDIELKTWVCTQQGSHESVITSTMDAGFSNHPNSHVTNGVSTSIQGFTLGIWLTGIKMSEFLNKEILMNSFQPRRLCVEGDISNVKITPGPGFLVANDGSDEWKASITIPGGYFKIKPSGITTPTSSSITFTDVKLRTWQFGQAINGSPQTWDLSYKPDINFPTSESSGSKYRKVSLIGMPIKDEKPQAEEESDYTPPETYVDALTQTLRHDSIDYSLQIPNSELSIAVRRNYAPQSWSLKSGLRPHERFDLPFGIGWSSNLISYVRTEETVLPAGAKRSSPDSVTVFDENGMSYNFIMADKDGMRVFYPLPNDKSDAQAYMNSLRQVGSNLVFKKKFGTELTYAPAQNTAQTIPVDRLSGSKTKTRYSYYALKEVKDRFGNSLVYTYEGNSPLLPSRIHYNKDSSLEIRIQENADGSVEKIYCPEGLVLNYSYTSNDYDTSMFSSAEREVFKAGSQVKTLSSVGNNDATIFNYSYGSASSPIIYEKDIWNFLSNNEAGTDYSHFHVNLTEIRDGENNKYSIGYVPLVKNYIRSSDNQRQITNGGVFSLRKGVYYVPSGGQRKVESLTVVDGRTGETVGTTTYSGSSMVTFGTRNNGGTYSLNSTLASENHRKLTVTDAEGRKIHYTWFDNRAGQQYESVVGREIDSAYDLYGLNKDDIFNNPIMIYYPKMRIEYADADGTIRESEEMSFKVDAGMSLESTEDMSGNVTSYAYEDPMSNISQGEIQYYYASKRLDSGAFEAPRYSDPTGQTDALGNETVYAYNEGAPANTDWRAMTSIRKYEGSGAAGSLKRRTQWTLDANGNRIKEEIFDENGTLVKTTENKFGDPDFPAFMTESKLVDGAGPGIHIVTTYEHDSAGRVKSSTTNGNITKYEYNLNGRKISETDPNGNTTRYVYNTLNRLVRIINPDGSERNFSYDTLGRKVSETDENGSTIYYEYNAMHQPVKVTRPLNAVTRTEYNSQGKPTKVIDPNGNVTEFEYDFLNRLVKKTQNGAVTTYEYGTNSGTNLLSGENFKPTRMTNTRGYVTDYTYDALFRLVKTDEQYAKDSDDSASYEGDGTKTTQFTYDIFGNKTSETDDNGNATGYTYDANDNLIKTTFADGATRLATYSSSGLVLTETDELGKVKENTYDESGRLQQKKYPLIPVYNGANERPTESYSYDANGNLIRKTDPNGWDTDYIFDSRNRLVSEVKPGVEDPLDGSVKYKRPTTSTEYDAVGNKVAVTDPRGNITRFEYDSLNRLKKTIFPAVDVTQYTGNKVTGSVSQVLFESLEYDANGNITKKTDTAGNETVTTYNYLNKPLTVKYPPLWFSQNPIDTFGYDTEGNLVSITDMGGIKTNYEYDGLNRRTKALYYATASSENQRSKSYVYDGLNLLIDNTVYKSYDNRNRISGTGPNESYTNIFYFYDKASRITSAKGAGSNIAMYTDYEYDANGLILMERSGNSPDRNIYSYDLSGNRRHAIYMTREIPAQGVMQEETSYDSNNRVTRIKDEKNRITRYYYDLNGNVAKKVYPNGDVITREYDALNRLVSTNTTNNGDVTLSCEYAYDAGGNLASFTQVCDGKTQALSMKYDPLNRLIYEYGCFDEYAEGQYQNDYKYKGYLLDYGWRYRGASSDFKYTYKPGTMMIDEVKNPDSSIAKFTYDSMGNITNIAVGNKRIEYKYNCYGWLTGTDEYGTPSVYSHTGYTYDYRGRRIIKIVAATTIETSNYWYSGGVCVMEGSDKTGRRLFYRGPDMGGGVGGINYSCKADGSDLNYKHYNLRGDVIVTTDSAGAVLSQSQYEAYGEHVDFGTMPVDKHRANTKVEDTETGLLLEGHRYRSLRYKTFMSPDPLEYADGLNLYAYCGYNPWGHWDPLGLKKIEKMYGDFLFLTQGNEPICNAMNSENISNAVMGEKRPRRMEMVRNEFYLKKSGKYAGRVDSNAGGRPHAAKYINKKIEGSGKEINDIKKNLDSENLYELFQDTKEPIYVSYKTGLDGHAISILNAAKDDEGNINFEIIDSNFKGDSYGFAHSEVYTEDEFNQHTKIGTKAEYTAMPVVKSEKNDSGKRREKRLKDSIRKAEDEE